MTASTPAPDERRDGVAGHDIHGNNLSHLMLAIELRDS
jgi:hypothetical protein